MNDSVCFIALLSCILPVSLALSVSFGWQSTRLIPQWRWINAGDTQPFESYIFFYFGAFEVSSFFQEKHTCSCKWISIILWMYPARIHWHGLIENAESFKRQILWSDTALDLLPCKHHGITFWIPSLQIWTPEHMFGINEIRHSMVGRVMARWLMCCSRTWPAQHKGIHREYYY